jgi:probable rRNA maturation factor
MDVAFVRRVGVRGGDGRSLTAFLRRVAGAALSSADEVTVVFAGDEEVAALNQRYRGKDRATDVRSFPGGADPDGIIRQGDIVVSVDRARRQAAQRHHSLDQELRYLLLHGFLHLMGYDHETDDGAMEREELRLRRLLIEPATGQKQRSSRP